MPAPPASDFFQDHRPPRILIVDDNPSIHRDFDLVFLDESANPALDADEQRLYGVAIPAAKKTVYILEHAHSGLEGLEKVARDKAAGRLFQLAFVDIRMPGMDGVETIGRLWKIDPNIQIVICTAYSDYSHDDLGSRLGQTDKLLLLKKPFDSIEVMQMARTLAEKWYLARQAALKLEQMELLVAQRTQQLLELRGPGAAPAAPRELDLPEERAPVVLLIESSPESAREICQTLGNDYEVVVVEDGAAAVEKARDLVPDLLIADTHRPGVDGVELCRKFKADVVTSHIPVILMALGEAADEPLAALQAGADDYVAQPLGVAALRARADHLLDVRRKSRPQLRPGTPWRPRELALNQNDARFLERAIAVIEQNLSDFEFDVDALARNVAVSRRQLFRKLKALVDTTPKALIRSVRLKRAAQLLAESEMTITEITFAVGFLDVKHFRALFKEEFGILPSEYIKAPH